MTLNKTCQSPTQSNKQPARTRNSASRRRKRHRQRKLRPIIDRRRQPSIRRPRLIQIRRRYPFHPVFRRILYCRHVQIRIRPRDHDRTVRRERRGGVVHARDARRGKIRLRESTPRRRGRVVIYTLERWIIRITLSNLILDLIDAISTIRSAQCNESSTHISIASRAGLRTINEKHSTIRQQQRIRHHSRLRHTLNLPPCRNTRRVKHHAHALTGCWSLR